MVYPTVSRTWMAAVVVLTLCAPVRARDGARIAAPDDPVAVAVRAQVKNYFSLLADGKWEAAADSCYCANEFERAASRARAEFASECLAFDRLAAKTLGVDAKHQFSVVFPPESVDAADVLLLDDRAMVTVNKGARFPLLRVNGTWRISVLGLAKIEGTSASVMAATYLSRIPAVKKLHADLERLDRETPDSVRRMMKEPGALARANEAGAVLPTPAELDRAPSDTTPAGALRRYVLYCAAVRPGHADVTAMCYATGSPAGALAQATSLYGGSEQYFYYAAVFRFGRAGADRIDPDHLSPQGIDQCTFKENGDTATATLPSGIVLPLIRIDGHWKLNVSELCRISGNPEAVMIRQNRAVAKILLTTAQEILNDKYASPEAVIAAMTAQGMRAPPPLKPTSASNASKTGETATVRE